MISPGVSRRAWRVFAMTSVLTLALPARPFAHEIPPSVMVFAFVKPEPNVLRLLVRVPLESIRDFERVLRGPGYLDLPSVNPQLRDAARVWIADYVELYENDRPLDRRRVVAARLSLPSDRSFVSYDRALANITGPPLADSTDLPWKQAMLDVMIEYQITSPTSKFSIRPALAHLGIRTTTVLRFVPPNGSERAFEYLGDPGLVRLDPRWHQAALRFVRLGFAHILDGIDHLLFVVCLVIPFRRLRALIAVVTSFTVAHSITLIASASGLAPDALWFPPLIEVLIALSIVYMAFENIVGAKIERRWIIAFAFGLGSRVWVLVHPAPVAPVRRLTSRDVAGRVQRGRGAWSALRAGDRGSGAGTALQVRRGRTDGDDSPVGAGGSYGVALDARARRGAQAVRVRVAYDRCSVRGERDAGAHVGADRRGGGVGIVRPVPEAVGWSSGGERARHLGSGRNDPIRVNTTRMADRVSHFVHAPNADRGVSVLYRRGAAARAHPGPGPSRDRRSRSAAR
jgi:hypothetical protein